MMIPAACQGGAYDLVQEAPSLPTSTIVQPQLLYTSNLLDLIAFLVLIPFLRSV
jgi:hypothetical protein